MFYAAESRAAGFHADTRIECAKHGSAAQFTAPAVALFTAPEFAPQEIVIVLPPHTDRLSLADEIHFPTGLSPPRFLV
jgi:hypothetical protein